MSLPNVKATYLAKAVGCSFGISSNGNYQIGIPLQIAEGDHQYETITWVGHFTEKTQDRTIESLQNMGWKGDDLSELADLDAARAAILLPDAVEIVCDVETYENELQLKVKWVNKPGAGRFAFKNKLEGAHLKSFAAQMKNAIRGAQGGRKPNGGGAPKPQPVHPNAPGADDDLPFASCELDIDPIARVLR